MTPGAPTDGARSRFPGHRGPTEAGTTLKDSGKRRHSSKGLHCGSPLIDEAGAEMRSYSSVPGRFASYSDAMSPPLGCSHSVLLFS